MIAAGSKIKRQPATPKKFVRPQDPRQLPRAATPDLGRSLRSARIASLHYLESLSGGTTPSGRPPLDDEGSSSGFSVGTPAVIRVGQAIGSVIWPVVVQLTACSWKHHRGRAPASSPRAIYPLHTNGAYAAARSVSLCSAYHGIVIVTTYLGHRIHPARGVCVNNSAFAKFGNIAANWSANTLWLAAQRIEGSSAPRAGIKASPREPIRNSSCW